MLPLTIDPMSIPNPNQVINLVSNLPPTTSANTGFQITNNQWIGSSFTTGNNLVILTSVTLRLGQFTLGSLFVKLYSNFSNFTGFPGYEINSFNVPSISGTNTYDFTLTNPYILTANTTYWLVAGISSGSGGYAWAFANSSDQIGELDWLIGDDAVFGTPSNEGVTWNNLTGYGYNGTFQFAIRGSNI